jgi:predicted MPP superfamily phosphohydrolase
MATVGILGNHDHGIRWSQPEVAREVAEMVGAFGVRILRNQVIEVEGLQIAGLGDLWGTGGQCKPPFLPPPLLPVRNKRYTSGEFALAGDRRLYISRGVGHLLRVRFNVRPEVTLFELTVA